MKVCLKSSYLWPQTNILNLRISMRVHLKGDKKAGVFSALLVSIGDGTFIQENCKINIPTNLCLLVNTRRNRKLSKCLSESTKSPRKERVMVEGESYSDTKKRHDYDYKPRSTSICTSQNISVCEFNCGSGRRAALSGRVSPHPQSLRYS